MTTWDTNNRLTQDTEMFDAIGKIRATSDKRREVEARVLAENNLASVRQLSEDKKKKFCAIVDALIAEQADVEIQLFPENDQNLIQAASEMKTSAWGTITEGAEGLQEISKELASRALEKATDFASKSGEGRKRGNHYSNRFADHDLGHKPNFVNRQTHGIQTMSGADSDEYATHTARRLAGHIIKKFRQPGADRKSVV